MQKIVLATGNQGKVKELNQMLAQVDIQIIAQTELNVSEADETGLTFVENAILKARNACAQTGLPAIADDSGLEVNYLKGAPGIYSSRYAGENASDLDNLNKLLDALKDVPAAQRSARFQSVLVFMRHENDPTPLICQGTWHGRITTDASGNNGFGYDPVFWVEEQNCTSADLPPETKNRLSHRGQALAQLQQQLDQLV